VITFEKSNKKMISTDYMEDDTIAFGLHNVSFHSVYDMGVEDTSSFSGKSLYDVASPDEGYAIDIGLPQDEVPNDWSLLEQLQLETSDDSHFSGSLSSESCSPRPSSTSSDALFTDDMCILSPFSESGDSGVSSCKSPYGELDSTSSLWLNEQFMNEDQLQGEFESLLENIQVPSADDGEMVEDSFGFDGLKNFEEEQVATPLEEFCKDPTDVNHCQLIEHIDYDVVKTDELVETDEVPFIEHTDLPPVVVEEGTPNEAKKAVTILPVPIDGVKNRQRIFILQTDSSTSESLKAMASNGLVIVKEEKVGAVRTSPYPKSRPSKVKTPQQKEKKKHQNRNAASRYRNKKKDELNVLFDEANKLEETNKDLSDQVTSLAKEIDYLKGLMLDVIKAKLSRSNSNSRTSQ